MAYRYLTVIGLWILCGAFVCQYEATPSQVLTRIQENDEGLSRRDLARQVRQARAVRIVYSDPAIYEPLAQKLVAAFPSDWAVLLQEEASIQADELRDLPLVILGREFQHPAVLQLLKQLPFQLQPDHFQFHGKEYRQSEQSFRLFLYPNPAGNTPVFYIGGNSEQAIRLQLTRFDGQSWTDLFWRSWGYEIYQQEDLLVRGNFEDRSWQFAPEQHFDFSDAPARGFISDHFQFHDHAGLGADFLQQLAATCEDRVRQLRAFTGSKRPVPTIHYHIYPSIEEKGLRLMNTQPGQLEPEQRTIHVVVNPTFQGQHTHQDIRLLLRDLLGAADRQFLAEGLAAHFNPQWQQKGAWYWAGRLYRSGNLPPLSEIIEDEWFERESPLVMTAAAGALVSFLIEQWGATAFLERYRKWATLGPAEREALENSWHHYLEGIAADDVRPPAPTLPYFRGFNFAHEGYQIYNGYGSTLARTSLEKLGRLGADAVAIVPYGYQRDPKRASFLTVRHGAGSENDESVVFAHAQAQRLGMHTLLKPQLWVSGSWPGEVTMPSDAAWEDFFDYYYRWIRHYALLAEIHRFDALCVGVEFSKATLSRPADWRKIIRRLRGLYSGPITYAANWGEEFEQLSFWDELDFIGLNSYYPLSEDDQPAKGELRSNFIRVLKRAERVSQKFGKPIVLTEVGFRSVAHSWKNPHAEANGRAYDPEGQRLCYEILLEGIRDKDWINGLFIWKWPSYLDYQAQHPVGFTPNNKPAELVVKQWFEDRLGR